MEKIESHFTDLGGPLDLGGAAYWPGLLDRLAQERIVEDIREVVRAAPLFQPETRRGQKLSVRMTSAGAVGWVSDRRGYRYEPRHPDGGAWPAIPDRVLEIWRHVAGTERLPDSCLVNFYGPEARMGMHQDRDERDLTAPVVSISLGDDALFRIGGAVRGGKTVSRWLRSGDVLVLQGSSRLAHHGIDRLRPGSSDLLKDGGRINLTLRIAT